VTQPSSPSESASRNWAGYAATGGPFTGVAATWSVPSFSPGTAAGIDATWVGIGGVQTTDLIQAGTQEMTSGTGTTEYEAWIEMLPRASQTVPLSIYPGDQISVSINQQSSTGWLISFANATTGQKLPGCAGVCVVTLV
jgi:Peptidase A4 family